ncbi:hypothetical protein ACMDCR_19050 [Labrys okinawensis]|uniref:hypothetical protein n=1 Tax=Labrys okinawensis TaxID=346911 RepID=UPI0039BC6F33
MKANRCKGALPNGDNRGMRVHGSRFSAAALVQEFAPDPAPIRSQPSSDNCEPALWTMAMQFNQRIHDELISADNASMAWTYATVGVIKASFTLKDAGTAIDCHMTQ